MLYIVVSREEKKTLNLSFYKFPNDLRIIIRTYFMAKRSWVKCGCMTTDKYNLWVTDNMHYWALTCAFVQIVFQFIKPIVLFFLSYSTVYANSFLSNHDTYCSKKDHQRYISTLNKYLHKSKDKLSIKERETEKERCRQTNQKANNETHKQ